jgi:8-oxo-dGTP pyrophosphatase MutT (NUDIX family)
VQKVSTEIDPPAELVPAATVVLLRDSGAGLEVLMLRRNSKIAFGGMWAFPGGKVEAADIDPDHPGDEMNTARRAGVRETEEETELTLDASALVPFSHWVPPLTAPRRFSTWFFLAAAPPEAGVVVDQGEIHEHAWRRPIDALASRDAGEIELAPPTWVTLWHLQRFGRAADALSWAGAQTPARYATRPATDGDAVVMVWEPDAGYGDGDLVRPGPRHRLYTREGTWHFQSAD